MATTPLIEAADVTSSSWGSTIDPVTVDYPAYVNGDLLIFHVGTDLTPTHTIPATGPNGETITTVVANESTAGDPILSVFYCIGDATIGAGSLNVTVSAAARGRGYCIKVLAGEFNAAAPIHTNVGQTGSSTGSDTTIDTDAFTADAVADGRLVHYLAADCGGVTTTISGLAGFSEAANDPGSITTAALYTRDAAVSSAESIGSSAFTIDDPDTNSAVSYVVNAPPDSVNTNIAVPTGPIR